MKNFHIFRRKPLTPFRKDTLLHDEKKKLSYTLRGGRIPLIVGGLKYGSGNQFANLPSGLTGSRVPFSGVPGPEYDPYLVQRNNDGWEAYVAEERAGNYAKGKTIVAYDSQRSRLAVVVQSDGGGAGRSLASIRDNLYSLGFDNALMFDGSDSATLVTRQGGVVVAPGGMKNSSIPTGVGVRSLAKPVPFVPPELRPGYPR